MTYMPELPEVEHVVRALRPIVTGRKIVSTELNLPRIVPEVSPSGFNILLRNQRIVAVERRGKYILFQLESGHVLAMPILNDWLCVNA